MGKTRQPTRTTRAASRPARAARRGAAARSRAARPTGSAATRPAIRPAATHPAAPGPGAPAPAAARLALARTCTLAQAEGLKLSLAALLHAVSPVTVEVDAIERIDTASLQLLVAFARERCAAGRAVRWSGRSAAFEEAARLLGLETLLASGATG